MKKYDSELIWKSYVKEDNQQVPDSSQATQQGGFRPPTGKHLKPIEQKIPTQQEIVDMVMYFRSRQGMGMWEDFKHYMEMSSPDWSNTMAYLMTDKGPGDYGDRLD